MHLAFALFLLLRPIAAGANVSDVCPMAVEVAKSGDFFINRFGGHYRTSPELLERDLNSGCYNDSHPSQVTSVTVTIVPGAPAYRVQMLFRILGRNRWPKSNVHIRH